MELYTIDRKGYLSAGQIIELTNYNDVDPPVLQDHVNSLFPAGVTSHGELYLLRGNTPANGVNAVIELLYEYVRRSNYLHRPSRFQSMFAVEDIQSAKLFRARYGNNLGAVWKVQCDNVFKADMNYLHMNCSLLTLSYNAAQYWNGQQSPTPFWEYLMKPPIQVVERVLEE